jgi:hypothetical protein
MGSLELEHCPNYSAFRSFSFEVSDNSVWQAAEPLSSLEFQQAYPPFEARQVFRCVCLRDPTGKYSDIPEAVAKVKYQYAALQTWFVRLLTKSIRITGNPCIINLLKRAVEDRESLVKAYPNDELLAADLENAKEDLRVAMNPVDTPNRATRLERVALFHFAKNKCASAPHFLAGMRDVVNEQIDPDGMAGGYARIWLMTKLPGQTLNDTFWRFPPEKRALVRDRFKAALQ